MGRRQKWDKEKVKQAILLRRENGLRIDNTTIRKEDGSLRGAIETHFGNLNNALLYCGLNPDDVYVLTQWNKNKIKTEFTKYIESNPSSSILQLSKNYRALDHAVRKHYGTYENLCDDLGIDVAVIKRQVREWKGEDLLNTLREMRDNGESLNIANVLLKFPSAYQVSTRCFGSYANALQEIGEEYEKFVDPLNFDSYIGKEFERLVNEMFIQLGYKYKYQKRLVNGTIMPDFYDEENNIFIDAKLSSWTVFHSDTLEKYIPHCNALYIIYLRGHEIEHEVSGMEMHHISYYFDELKARNLGHFISQFEGLQAKLIKEAV